MGARRGRATARIDLVVLGPAISDRLRVNAAHHGEWRVTTRTRTASRGSGGGGSRCARAVPGWPAATWPARRGGHRALRGREGARGRAGPADLELAFPSGPPLPDAPAGIRLRFDDDEQRRLAEALAGQERVAILMLDVGGAWLAQVELELGQEGRELIADASRRR